MESEPWARFSTAGGPLRILAIGLQRRRLRARGERVAPLAWRGIATAIGIVVSVIIGAIAAASVLRWLLHFLGNQGNCSPRSAPPCITPREPGSPTGARSCAQLRKP